MAAKKPRRNSRKSRAPSLRDQAMAALIESIPIAESGPATMRARDRLSAWLKNGRVPGGVRQVRSDIAKLTLAAHSAVRKFALR